MEIVSTFISTQSQDISVQAIVTRRRLGLPDHLEIVKSEDVEFHHADSADDFCSLQHRSV